MFSAFTTNPTAFLKEKAAAASQRVSNLGSKAKNLGTKAFEDAKKPGQVLSNASTRLQRYLNPNVRSAKSNIPPNPPVNPPPAQKLGTTPNRLIDSYMMNRLNDEGRRYEELKAQRGNLKLDKQFDQFDILFNDCVNRDNFREQFKALISGEKENIYCDKDLGGVSYEKAANLSYKGFEDNFHVFTLKYGVTDRILIELRMNNNILVNKYGWYHDVDLQVKDKGIWRPIELELLENPQSPLGLVLVKFKDPKPQTTSEGGTRRKRKNRNKRKTRASNKK